MRQCAYTTSLYHVLKLVCCSEIQFSTKKTSLKANTDAVYKWELKGTKTNYPAWHAVQTKLTQLVFTIMSGSQN